MARWRVVDERVDPSVCAAVWLVESIAEGHELEALDVAPGRTMDALQELFAGPLAAGTLIIDAVGRVAGLDVETVQFRSRAGDVWEYDFELGAGGWFLV